MIIDKAKISRRSFIAGGFALLAASGIPLSSCNSRKTNDNPNWNGDLFASIAYETKEISPIGATNALSLSCAWHTYEGLYDIDYHDYSVYNGLAAKEPIKVDNTTYDVVLRDEAYYWDGSKVKPEDVVNAFKLNINNKNYSTFLSFIKDVNVKDPKTVEFHLRYPFDSLFKTRISLVKVFPCNYKAEDLANQTMGSGPWYVKKFNRDDGKIEFNANPYYEGKFKTDSSYMSWEIQLDEEESKNSICDKSIYVTEVFNEDRANDIRKAGATVDFIQGFNCPLICFNTLKKPFDNYRVRRALYCSLDIEKMINEVLDGHASIATSLLPKNHKNYNKSKYAYDKNNNNVNTFLKDEDYEKRKLKVLINSNWVKNLAPYVKNDMENIGLVVDVDIKSINWKSFEGPNGMGEYDFLITPGDPSSFSNDPDLLMSFWYGDNLWMNNYSSWKKTSPDTWKDLNNYLQQAREATNVVSQQKLWNTAQDNIYENCVVLPLFHREIGTAYFSDRIHNYEPISTTGMFFLGTFTKA